MLVERERFPNEHVAQRTRPRLPQHARQPAGAAHADVAVRTLDVLNGEKATLTSVLDSRGVSVDLGQSWTPTTAQVLGTGTCRGLAPRRGGGSIDRPPTHY